MDYNSILKLPLPHPIETLKAQVEALKAHEVIPAEYHENLVRYDTDYGDLSIEVTNDGWSIKIIGTNENGLEILKNFIIEHILEHYPNIPEEILQWQGYESDTGYPSNFRLVEIIEKKLIDPNMIRLTVKGNHLASYAENGLHFQLLIPSNEKLPAIWPTKKTSGKIHYPIANNGNEQGLDRRVYTIRQIRVEQNEFDFDVLRHAGGIASDWAENVSIGDKIGILGPSGGHYPEANWLMLAGDETALPAIARILENCPKDTTGEAIISLKDVEKWTIQLNKPDGINIQWLDHSKGNMIDTIKALGMPENQSAYFWFGGESETAADLRKYFKHELGLSSKQYYSSAYWLSTSNT
ncbi:siderophore-interacting protein [Curvivirga aplysinae]|uniref:siderophore-interacting protein n=1 Tax=Curvivirga aplysinae TaxID=2529852 RepID=UPI0012BCDD03|nr:siderophore-interacting protein [Curvivirga aplysinae]MTI10366.1 siderophore-interacting protein [Curvivirga aplysinae]